MARSLFLSESSRSSTVLTTAEAAGGFSSSGIGSIVFLVASSALPSLARAREKARVMRSTGEGGGLAIICCNR